MCRFVSSAFALVSHIVPTGCDGHLLTSTLACFAQGLYTLLSIHLLVGMRCNHILVFAPECGGGAPALHHYEYFGLTLSGHVGISAVYSYAALCLHK